jgi:HEAT repeat protein
VNGALTTALKDPDVEVRASAALALGWKGNLAAIPALTGALSDPGWQVVDASVTALGEIGISAIDGLVAAIRNPGTSMTVRYQIARAFSEMGRRAVPKLVAALSDPDPTVQKWAAVSLGTIGDQSAVGALKQLAGSADPDVRWVVEEQLRRLTSLAGT